MNIESKHLIIAASNDCFVKCRGCYNFWGANKQIVSTECILNFLKQLDSERIEKITVSGGDPLIRPDIIELLSEIKGLRYKINMDTVGTGLLANTESVSGKTVKQIDAQKLSELVDVIGIPLDGCASDSIHTFRLGRSNIFQEQIAILSKLDQAGANICINTVVHKQNLRDVSDIVDVIHGFNHISKWQLFQYMPIGVMGYKNRGDFEISDEEFLGVIYNVSERAKIKIPSVIFNPKAKNQRQKLYLLIDTDGYAWTPLTVVDDKFWQRSSVKNDKRIILGNIKNSNEMRQILDFLYYGKLNKGIVK